MPNDEQSLKYIYWTTTLLLVIPFLGIAMFELAGSPNIVQTVMRLGYPRYLLTLLGVANVFGAGGLLLVKVRWVKEWAYAGFAFELLGAIVSHMVVLEIRPLLAPLIFLIVLAASRLAWVKLEEMS